MNLKKGLKMDQDLYTVADVKQLKNALLKILIQLTSLGHRGGRSDDFIL